MTFAALLFLAQLTPAPVPHAGHVLVSSPRERGVLLVGGDATGTRPLYRLQGDEWAPIQGSELPVRSLPAAATDAQGNLLMHGGSIAVERPEGGRDFQVTGETWLWDGSKWTRVAESGPAARDHHALAFDSRREVFVLFGGSDADPSGRSVLYGDTWEWNGKEWKLVAESGPSARAHHALAFDPVRGVTLLAGGADDPRTWAWDGHAWKSVASGQPAARSSPRMAWDPKRERIVLFGGMSDFDAPSDTWAWDGERWSTLATDGPPGRCVHGLAFDAERGGLVLFAGSDGMAELDDLWLLGDAWKRVGE